MKLENKYLPNQVVTALYDFPNKKKKDQYHCFKGDKLRIVGNHAPAFTLENLETQALFSAEGSLIIPEDLATSQAPKK